MTQAPTKPPIDDEEEGEEKPEASNEFQYQQRRPRSLIFGLSIVALVALLAVVGIVRAIISSTEDPNAIKFPDHVSKSLAEEHPIDTSGAPHGAPAIEAYHAEGKIDETEPVSALPEDNQTEDTLDLNTATPASEPTEQTETPVAPAVTPADNNGDEKVDEKKPVAGPQSMIIWDRHITAPPTNADHKPQIVVVIDDMGLNHRNSKTVSSMAGSLTLAYLPYAENLPKQTAEARANGHELIVHVPMEPDNLKQNNPGPNALLSTNAPEENVRRLDKSLGNFTGYIGINNHMGSHLTANAAAMTPIIKDLKARGLWFLDSRTIGNSVAGKIAGDLGVPYVVRDVFLDNVASVPAILAQLREAEAVAKKRGYAVAIGHPYDATIAALKQWMPQAQAKGFEMVPLSTVIAQRFPSATVPQYAQLKKRNDLNTVEPAAGMTMPTLGVHASSLQSAAQVQ